MTPSAAPHGPREPHAPREQPATGRLSAVQGTALYVGAVLGTGVIALPSLAAEVAGPASLLAWLGLVVLSAPLAATFAALGARHPDAGGVATYARHAFGERAFAVVGWCFLLAVPPGASAAALFGGAYVAAAFGGGTTTTAVTALVLMTGVTAANAAGLKVTGRLQTVLAVLLVVLLLSAVALSLPDARAAHLEPFAPHGWTAVAPAAALLVWSFAGWEAITHLAGEFRRPARDLPRAAGAAVVIVGALYLLVAFAVITVLGPAAGDTEAPLGELMARAMGTDARFPAAAAAVLLTTGAMNAYYAGAANLAAALGRDGALPPWLSRGSAAGEIPRRGLGLVAALGLASLTAVLVTGVGTDRLVLLTTGSFVTVYAVGVAAALRLLPRRTAGHRAAVVASGAVVLMVAMSGVYLLWPLAVATAALLYRARRVRRAVREPLPEPRVVAPRRPSE
ncbi:APC family permease [Streptomyces avicenniae]|uniref:APC family permease n=1 Tax=Streptomyces avicenniae TaxID=500153 RepID=UPI000A9838B0|nr:amino acid permease [Streptomyces avicenniae]